MKKLMIAIIVLALLFFGCVMVPSSGQNTKSGTDQLVPATSGGTTVSGEDLPPLPPDNENVAGSVVIGDDEFPPMPN